MERGSPPAATPCRRCWRRIPLNQRLLVSGEMWLRLASNLKNPVTPENTSHSTKSISGLRSRSSEKTAPLVVQSRHLYSMQNTNAILAMSAKTLLSRWALNQPISSLIREAWQSSASRVNFLSSIPITTSQNSVLSDRRHVPILQRDRFEPTLLEI
jgi:hypothetical protein